MALSFEALKQYIDEPNSRADFAVPEIVQGFLSRIVAEQPRLNAMITILADDASCQAEYVDACRRKGRPLPLGGMPIVIKDNIDYRGSVTTVGSAFYAKRPAAAKSALVVEKLQEAGAIVLGKAHLHELLYGVTSSSEVFGNCRNPYDVERIPGGSSGGSGAALAADLCVAALGSDTGGSIRIPSALCGVAGHRPSFGKISTYGVHPLVPMYDTVGPMARSLVDVRSIFRAIVGYDPRDDWSVYPSVSARPDDNIDSVRVGYDPSLIEMADREIAAALQTAIAQFKSLGAEIVECRLAMINEMHDVFRGLVDAGAYSVNREALDSGAELLGVGTRQRLEIGKSVKGADVFTCLQKAQQWRQYVAKILREKFDVLICPTVLVSAPRLSEMSGPYTPPNLGAMTYPWVLASVAALSVPCGFTIHGLPIGMQLISGWGRDELLFKMGAAYQDVTPWHRRRPGDPAPAH